MNIKHLALIILAMITLMSLLPDDSMTQARQVEYTQMHDLVSSVSHPLLGQFCKHGATLILLGRYEQAKQYEEDFGSCMRNLVKKVQLLR